MRKLIMLAGVVALVLPVAGLAETTPNPSSLAQKTCRQLQTSMGANFAPTYGTNADRSNAFGQCVKKNTPAATQQIDNAAKTCKAEQADASFATNHGGKTFVQFYAGTNAKGAGAVNNAYGKCVSQHANAAASAHAAALTKAAKTCKAARKADAAAFGTKWGTGRNAFGKCVAATAKA
jgi:hypothetical protein